MSHFIDGTPFGDLLDRVFDGLEARLGCGCNKRARTKCGKYIPDDPTTPKNEAWTKGKAPKKKKSKK